MQSRRSSDEWRFAAHPAFGLKLTGPGEPRMPRPTQLGFAWLRRSRDEQARHRRAFFATLLTPWLTQTTFHVRGLGEEDAAGLLSFDDVETSDADVVVSGPLTEATLDALLGSDARSIVVRRDGRPLLTTRDGWHAAIMHLTEDEEHAARERLLAARGGPTEAAARDRRGRALAYLAIHYATVALAALVGWLALRQLGSAFPTALAIALGIAVAVTFFSLLSPLHRLAAHWYGPG